MSSTIIISTLFVLVKILKIEPFWHNVFCCSDYCFHYRSWNLTFLYLRACTIRCFMYSFLRWNNLIITKLFYVKSLARSRDFEFIVNFPTPTIILKVVKCLIPGTWICGIQFPVCLIFECIYCQLKKQNKDEKYVIKFCR